MKFSKRPENQNLYELTEREEKIILIKYIIHGVSPFSDVPLKLRVKMLVSAAKICGYEYDDVEWQKLGRSIIAVHYKVNEKLAGMLSDNKDLVKTVMDGLKNGNENIITVADDILDGGLKKIMGDIGGKIG